MIFVSSSCFFNFWLLEFLGFPKGSLWEHFSDIWVSIGDHLGVYWIPLGTLWIPLGTLLDHFGITLVVLGPPWALFWWLWHHFSAFWLQKEPNKLWREVLGSCFCEFIDILCELGRKKDDRRCAYKVFSTEAIIVRCWWYLGLLRVQQSLQHFMLLMNFGIFFL